MDLEALRFANFSMLDQAVTHWSTMTDDLNALEEDAREGLRNQANRANWAGLTATVSREFIGKTAGEFKDAFTQSRSIHKILQDTRDELKDYHRKLNEAIERGLKKNLSVTSTSGGGFTVTMNVHPDRAGKGTNVPDHGEADVTALRDEIQKILNDATESDSTASKVLKAIADQSKYGFSDVSYQDRDSAVRATEEADALAKLAGKAPENLSIKEFDRLNAGLKKYADDPLFSERFAEKLGAKGTLEFWAGINDPHRNPELGQARVEKFDDLQKNLSLTLAHATQGESQGMAEWKREMTNLGSQPVGKNIASPMGFQVMSNLMRWGDYDDKFLNSYGNELMKTEKKLSDNGTRVPNAWEHSGMDSYLNRTGTDSGSDPMTGFMKALSNSPDAATEFFNDPFIGDNSFEKEDDDGEIKKISLTNFQYLFEERDWPREQDDKGEDSIAGRNNLAMALEAATTGHAAGEMPTVDTPAHNSQQAKLTEDIIKSISENPEPLIKHGYMSDSIGQIAAEYMPDIHRGFHAGNASEDGLFPIAGSAADIKDPDLTRFLYTLGRNPDGYAAVNLGQHAYTASLMEYHFQNPDILAANSDFPQRDILKSTADSIALGAGKLEGVIASGRAYEGEIDGGAKDEQYNSALKSASTWGGSVVGIGIGLGTAPMLGPGGVVTGGLAGTAASEIISSLTDGSMKDSAGDQIYQNGEQIHGTKESTYELVEKSAGKAGIISGNGDPHITASVANQAERGFDEAQGRIDTYIEGQGVPKALETEDK